MRKRPTRAFSSSRNERSIGCGSRPRAANGARRRRRRVAKRSVWDISRYGSLRVIKVAAQINQNWYAGPAPYRTRAVPNVTLRGKHGRQSQGQGSRQAPRSGATSTGCNAWRRGMRSQGGSSTTGRNASSPERRRSLRRGRPPQDPMWARPTTRMGRNQASSDQSESRWLHYHL